MFPIGGMLSLLNAQCTGAINTFPFHEDFEMNDGSWIPGGTGSDWAWGHPDKPVITGAGSGTKCWITGGLNGSNYNDGEASWLQSPCFDFTNLAFPYITMKLFWETEQQFDGASFQYSIDNGISWVTIGISNETNCLNSNWYNTSSITYLASLTTNRSGWSGNTRSTSGSCRGGNGSNGWVEARHLLPDLAGEPTVIFRFIFGAGTICNNYDGFAVDDIHLGEAPDQVAAFDLSCVNEREVRFINESLECPSQYLWDFGDPGSGSSNTSNQKDPVHIYGTPGIYTVTLKAMTPGTEAGVFSRDIIILSVTTSVLAEADCNLNNGGAATAVVTGSAGPFTYTWTGLPGQSTPVLSNVAAGDYSVLVESPGACPVSADITIPYSSSCTDIYFPTAFTPNADGRNDWFGALGGIGIISRYQLSIYNRWGNLVFQTSNPFQKWDGTWKGQQPDPATFVWIAEIELPGNTKQVRKGVVTLIR
jgi:gliding motility-associated-like protein